MFLFQEKVYQWIWRQQEGGSRVGTVDVLNYIQVGLAFLPLAYNIVSFCMFGLLELGDCSVANRDITHKIVLDYRFLQMSYVLLTHKRSKD